MAVSVILKLDKRFYRQAKGVYEKYDFDVGILNDGVHRAAYGKKKGLKNFAGGPARKTSQTPDGTLGQLSEELRANLGINFYTQPFKLKQNRDILRFAKSFFDLCAGRTVKKRAENLLQAIVRNPMLRGDYGGNSVVTQKIKGFNRLMIDTGQLFKGITAKVRTRRV